LFPSSCFAGFLINIVEMRLADIPILGALTPGATQRHVVKLPGAALANDEPRAVVSVTGANPGPMLFVNAGVHGGEYPAIEAVIRLSKTLDPQMIAGAVILMPVLNLPAFRSRTPFVCPVDNVNPNRVFPGDPNGSYSEQMTHALMNEFVVHADAYVDLHGGDIPEALVPFVICRSDAGLAANAPENVAARSKAMALAFGLPYVLTVSKPVEPAKGLSSYAAVAEKGTPAILAEAGGVGQLRGDAVELLVNGVKRVMAHLKMLSDGQALGTSASTMPTILTRFEWLYSKYAGMWYPRVTAGDLVEQGQEIGRIGDLFGDTLETIIAPVSGRVLFLTVNPSVQENGLLMGVGVE
jgi:predicted deacylase